MPNADYRPLGTPAMINKVSTSDASSTQAQLVPIPSDGVYQLESQVLAARTGGSSGAPGDSACYNRTVRVKRVSGTVTIPRLQSSYTDEDQRTWRVDFQAFGQNVKISVQGSAANTINWTVVSRLYKQL